MMLIPALLALVGQVVPSLVGLLAGDRARDVAQRVAAVAQAVTGTETQEAAAAALQADPAKLAALQVRLAEIALAAERTRQADAADARAREIALHDWTPRVLAMTVTIGLFGLLGILSFCNVPVANQSALQILLGAVSGGFGAVLGYYYGMSAPQPPGGGTPRPFGK